MITRTHTFYWFKCSRRYLRASFSCGCCSCSMMLVGYDDPAAHPDDTCTPTQTLVEFARLNPFEHTRSFWRGTRASAVDDSFFIHPAGRCRQMCVNTGDHCWLQDEQRRVRVLIKSYTLQTTVENVSTCHQLEARGNTSHILPEERLLLTLFFLLCWRFLLQARGPRSFTTRVHYLAVMGLRTAAFASRLTSRSNMRLFSLDGEGGHPCVGVLLWCHW